MHRTISSFLTMVLVLGCSWLCHTTNAKINLHPTPDEDYLKDLTLNNNTSDNHQQNKTLQQLQPIVTSFPPIYYPEQNSTTTYYPTPDAGDDLSETQTNETTSTTTYPYSSSTMRSYPSESEVLSTTLSYYGNHYQVPVTENPTLELPLGLLTENSHQFSDSTLPYQLLTIPQDYWGCQPFIKGVKEECKYYGDCCQDPMRVWEQLHPQTFTCTHIPNQLKKGEATHIP